MGSLQGVLRSVVGDGKLLSIQPGGNHGDDLIYRGFDEMISELGCERVPFAQGNNRYDRPPDVPSVNMIRNLRWFKYQMNHLSHRISGGFDAVYIHGGGNFNDIWQGGVACYRTAARYFDCPLIIGPQSCQFETTDPSTIFKDIDNETHFFCREEYSYALMKDAADNQDHVSVYLDDDTALSVSEDTLSFANRGTEYELIAMRADAESTSPFLQESINPPIKVSDISNTTDSFEIFVQTAARAKHIHTDRLHVAILATLLNKPVTWYEVGYHKSRGVYEYSLSDNDNIKFMYRDDVDE